MGAETCAGYQATPPQHQGMVEVGANCGELCSTPKRGFGTLEPAVWQPSCLSFPCLSPLHARVPADVTRHVAMMLGQEQLWWCPEEIRGREMFLWHGLLGARMQPLLRLRCRAHPAACPCCTVPGPCHPWSLLSLPAAAGTRSP